MHHHQCETSQCSDQSRQRRLYALPQLRCVSLGLKGGNGGRLTRELVHSTPLPIGQSSLLHKVLHRSLFFASLLFFFIQPLPGLTFQDTRTGITFFEDLFRRCVERLDLFADGFGNLSKKRIGGLVWSEKDIHWDRTYDVR